jgi:hypothetical protein
VKTIETPPKNGKLQSFSGDERWELLQRVLASSHFQKSARHRELLAYVTERILREPGVEIHEQEIASNVFQRPAGGIKGEDTIVRVQAYQLRKRLDSYFATVGALEPLIIEIPKGNYAPVFKERKPAEIDAGEPIAPKRDLRTPLIWLLAGLTTILAALCLFLAFRNAAPAPPAPALNQLWAQFARKDRRVDIVLADSSLSLLADVIRRPIGLREYLKRDYWKESDNLPEKDLREVARMLMSRQHTSIGDANLASRFSSLTGRQGANTTLFFARDFNIRNLKTDNIIILGSSRSNPWAELFENQLNFRFTYDERTHSAIIENKAPLPGEASRYRVQIGANRIEESYCRIALLPNSDHTGDVLLIAGTEMEATEAGGEFLTSEQGISQLRRRLSLNGSDRIPYFELLLKTTRIGGAAPSFEVFTHRLPRV